MRLGWSCPEKTTDGQEEGAKNVIVEKDLPVTDYVFSRLHSRETHPCLLLREG